MSLDLSDDWTIADDPQSVTYYVKTGEGTFATGVVITYVQNGANVTPSGQELAINQEFSKRGMFEVYRSSFHLWTAKLNNIIPALGDKILDQQNIIWYIEKITPCDLDSSGVFQRYKVIGIKGT